PVADAEAAAIALPPVAPVTLNERAARWDGMTAGLVVAIVVISVGSLINVMGALVRYIRRRKERQ
ncbi:MAG: hypothetical protein NZM00_06675, partial [Anaerolinea sp.]|nr:hypothetical protein [Anaerolinea sp.]